MLGREVKNAYLYKKKAMKKETKVQAQIIFDAISAMLVAYEKINGEETGDELDSILYSVHVVLTEPGFTDAEILEMCFDCLQLATESFQN